MFVTSYNMVIGWWLGPNGRQAGRAFFSLALLPVHTGTVGTSTGTNFPICRTMYFLFLLMGKPRRHNIVDSSFDNEYIRTAFRNHISNGFRGEW